MMMDGSNSICARWQLFSTGEVSQLLWGLINRTHLMMREDRPVPRKPSADAGVDSRSPSDIDILSRPLASHPQNGTSDISERHGKACCSRQKRRGESHDFYPGEH